MQHTMEIDSSFRYCRGCKLPENEAQFKSLFKEPSEYCKFFQSLAGINISSDEDNNDALLCDTCWLNLDNSCVFIKCVRKTEEEFYKSFRKLNDSKAFDTCRACLKQEDATHLSDLFEETSDAVKILQLVSNVDISSDKNKFKAMICDKCIDILGMIYQYRCLIRNAEKTFFKVKRQIKEIESKESERKASLRKALTSNVKNSEVVASSSSAKESPVNRNSSKSDSLKCQICDKKFLTEQSLKRHIRGVHEKIRKFYCDSCPASFYCKNKIQSHMGQHMSFDQRSLNCLVCQKSYKWKQDLKLHNESIHEKITFQCQLCQKHFTSKKGLKRHINEVHLKILYDCLLCNRKYTRNENLLHHVKSFHEQIKRFNCEICQKSWYHKYDMKRHQDNHHK